MTLTRLSELAALFQPKPVQEARVKTRNDLEKKFDSMSEGVESAMKDLEYEIGAGGVLETMIEDIGMTSHKAVVPLITELNDKIKAFKKDVSNLMMEAEGLLFSAKLESKDDRTEYDDFNEWKLEVQNMDGVAELDGDGKYRAVGPNGDCGKFDKNTGKGWLTSCAKKLKEGKNHLGETEYSSYASWKAGIKKAVAAHADKFNFEKAELWYDGDKDICNAMYGAKPFKRGETIQIGEWDGAVGSVHNL